MLCLIIGKTFCRKHTEEERAEWTLSEREHERLGHLLVGVAVVKNAPILITRVEKQVDKREAVAVPGADQRGAARRRRRAAPELPQSLAVHRQRVAGHRA